MVRVIGLALSNGFALPAAATIVEVFQAANAAVNRPGKSDQLAYEVCLLSAAGGRVASSSSVSVWTESVETYRNNDKFHAIFVVGAVAGTNGLRDERLVTWLRRAYPTSELVFPVGEGRMLLEAAGFGHALSDWRARVPSTIQSVNALPNATDTLESLQTALAVVTEDFGEEVAHQISNWVAPPPPTQFSSIVRKNASVCVSEKIRESARWIQANGDRPISIDDAAQVAAMSERNFLRRFKMEIGVTPSDYLLYVRLDMCCRLLVETDLPIDKIARRCGIGSGGRLSKLFRKHLTITPTEYRSQNRLTER
ncbi:MAG TPA: helix-turn-helix domain-containing protein [Trinickia sp.]|jgi:transcriptional regulator GlxA family with amidase domain|nr:helix-turn-helix domain-containing protein [Trinickia sp.]HTI18887.1 helix-turn-helix domain-containing protein [Trinickia sp.]